MNFLWLRSLGSANSKCSFLLTLLPYHFFQVPQLNRRSEAPWYLSTPVSLIFLFTQWCSATGLPSTGQHLQPPSHPLLTTWVLTGAHTSSHSTGPHCRYQAKACTTLLRQHRHTTPEQVRRMCACVCVYVVLATQTYSIVGSEITSDHISRGERQYMQGLDPCISRSALLHQFVTC